MVVEHEFVTTVEEEETMRRAETALLAMGFLREPAPAEAGLVCRRGKKSARRARKVNDTPQLAAVQFDRGRVTLAASAEHPGKAPALLKEMMLTLASTVERAVGSAGTGADILSEWRAVNGRIDRRFRRINVAAWTILLTILVGLLALIVFAVATL